jgi:trimeric autotransporter adhesin
MKKVLLSLLAVAALVLSCQNYDEEFDSLNSKIASLEAQISSLADLRTAITGVQSTVSSLQTAVSAAEAAANSAATTAAAAAAAAADAVDSADAASAASAASAAQAATAAQANATSIAALATSLSAIAADITDLETAVAAASTSADLDALKSELTESLSALDALIDANTADIVKILANNASLSTALTALGVDLKALIEANADEIADLVANDAVVQSSLRELGVDVDSIIAQNSTFEGNLTITSAAELVYAKSLGNKVATIKGDVYVEVDQTKTDGAGTGEGLTAAGVNEVLSLMKYVVGNVKLVTDASLDVSGLISVTGDYIVTGHDVSDDSLTAVGDDVYFNYDGEYKSNIQTADNIYLVMNSAAKANTTAGTSAKSGTTGIDFLALTKATGVQSIAANSSHTSGGSVVLSSGADTKSIAVNAVTEYVKIGQAQVISVTSSLVAASTALTNIELHYLADTGSATLGLNPNGVAKLGSLTITGGEISSVIVKAKQITGAVNITVTGSTATSNSATVDLSDLLTSGAINSDASTNDISSLKTAGGIILSQQVSFSAPALTGSTGDITLAKATSFSAPNLVNVGVVPTTAAPAGTRMNMTVDLVEGNVELSKLTFAGVISFAEATSFIAAAADVTSINIAAGTALVPTTVELLTVPDGGILDEVTVGTVKLHGQKVIYFYQNMDAVTSLTVIGVKNSTTKVAPNVTVGSATSSQNGSTFKNSKLATLTLGGDLGTVIIDMDAENSNAATGHSGTALTTVKTSGTIESITIDDNYDLNSLTLDHTDSTTSSTASIIKIRGNHNLESVKTNVSTISTLDVSDNGKLDSLNFASITKLPTNYTSGDTVSINIEDNFTDKGASEYTTKYTATATVPAVATNPLDNWLGMTGTVNAATATVARSYVQGGLASLVPFFQVLEDTFNPSTGTGKGASGVSITMNYKYQSLVGSTLTVATQSWSISGTASANAGIFDQILDLD